MEHFIITRYSIKKDDSFRYESDDLFSDNRLNNRFDIFKTITFPSVINQTNKDFKWIILVDQNLPVKHLKKLQKLTSSFNFIYLITYNPELDFNKLKFIEDEIGEISSKYVITTRLDDDDGLNINFVSQAQKDAEINANEDILFLTYPKGLHWQPSQESEIGEFALSSYYSNALGLSLVTIKEKYPITVYGWNHTKIINTLVDTQVYKQGELHDLSVKCGDKMELWNANEKIKIIISDDYMYFRAIHLTNDSAHFTSLKYFEKKLSFGNLEIFGLNREGMKKLNKRLISGKNKGLFTDRTIRADFRY